MYKEIMMEVLNKMTVNDMREEIHEHVSSEIYGFPYNRGLPNFDDFNESQAQIAINYMLDCEEIQGDSMSEIHKFITERIIK